MMQAILGPHYMVVVWSIIAWLSVAAALIYFSWQLGATAAERIPFLLSMLVGGLLGWAAGMYFAPYGDVEAGKFVSLGQAVSAFVSGYLVSKVDRFLEVTLFQDGKASHKPWLGAGIFVSAFVTSALVIYTCRSYVGAG